MNKKIIIISICIIFTQKHRHIAAVSVTYLSGILISPWTLLPRCVFWYKLTIFGIGTTYNTHCDIFQWGTKTFLHKSPNLHKLKIATI